MPSSATTLLVTLLLELSTFSAGFALTPTSDEPAAPAVQGRFFKKVGNFFKDDVGGFFEEDLGGALHDGTSAAIGWMGNAATTTGDFFVDAGTTTGDFLETSFTSAGSVMIDAGSSGVALVSRGTKDGLRMGEAWLERGGTLVTDGWDDAVDWTVEAGERTVDWLERVGQDAGEWFTDFGRCMLGSLPQCVEQAAKGIKKGVLTMGCVDPFDADCECLTFDEPLFMFDDGARRELLVADTINMSAPVVNKSALRDARKNRRLSIRPGGVNKVVWTGSKQSGLQGTFQPEIYTNGGLSLEGGLYFEVNPVNGKGMVKISSKLVFDAVVGFKAAMTLQKTGNWSLAPPKRLYTLVQNVGPATVIIEVDVQPWLWVTLKGSGEVDMSLEAFHETSFDLEINFDISKKEFDHDLDFGVGSFELKPVLNSASAELELAVRVGPQFTVSVNKMPLKFKAALAAKVAANIEKDSNCPGGVAGGITASAGIDASIVVAFPSLDPAQWAYDACIAAQSVLLDRHPLGEATNCIVEASAGKSAEEFMINKCSKMRDEMLEITAPATCFLSQLTSYLPQETGFGWKTVVTFAEIELVDFCPSSSGVDPTDATLGDEKPTAAATCSYPTMDYLEAFVDTAAAAVAAVAAVPGEVAQSTGARSLVTVPVLARNEGRSFRMDETAWDAVKLGHPEASGNYLVRQRRGGMVIWEGEIDVTKGVNAFDGYVQGERASGEADFQWQDGDVIYPVFPLALMQGHCTDYSSHSRHAEPKDVGECATLCRESDKYCVAIAFNPAADCVLYYGQCTDTGPGTDTWGFTYLKRQPHPVVEVVPMQGACKLLSFTEVDRLYAPTVPNVEACASACRMDERGCVAIAWKPDEERCDLYMNSCVDSGAGAQTWGKDYYSIAYPAPIEMKGHCNHYPDFEAVTVQNEQQCMTRCRVSPKGCVAFAFKESTGRCNTYYGRCIDSYPDTEKWGFKYFMMAE